MEQIFRHAFQHNIWGDPESVSGPGSGLARTALFRERIPPLLAEIGAKSLLDAGCGDFNWMKELKPPGEQYIGIDIVSELITHNIQKFGRAGRRFIHGDILCYDLPKVDVILFLRRRSSIAQTISTSRPADGDTSTWSGLHFSFRRPSD